MIASHGFGFDARYEARKAVSIRTSKPPHDTSFDTENDMSNQFLWDLEVGISLGFWVWDFGIHIKFPNNYLSIPLINILELGNRNNGIFSLWFPKWFKYVHEQERFISIENFLESHREGGIKLR